jgi:hypothetical protein
VSVLCFLLHFPLAICCSAAELKQKTIEAFDRYVRVTDARIEAELRPGGPFLWVDSLLQPRRQRLYDLLRRGQLEIRQERLEEEGKPFEVPDGLIHHWSGVAFAPGISLERALSLLQDYDNHWRTYKPDVRRSKLLEHTGNTFKVYLQFYKGPPRHVSFNSEFEVHYTRIDATHAFSRAASIRIAELEHPDQPDSSEVAVGQGHGYLWRLNNYWRLEEKDGGVYMQVETIGLSRDVPAIFAWFVNPLILRVSRQTLANLLYATRRGVLNPDTGTAQRPQLPNDWGLDEPYVLFLTAYLASRLHGASVEAHRSPLFGGSRGGEYRNGISGVATVQSDLVFSNTLLREKRANPHAWAEAGSRQEI